MLTIKQLALQLNVKESWLRSQIFRRKIVYHKLGSQVRFDELEINKWIQNTKVNNTKSGEKNGKN